MTHFISCGNGGDNKNTGSNSRQENMQVIDSSVIQAKYSDVNKNNKEPFTLNDFYSDNSKLDSVNENVFSGLSDEECIGQMIVVSAGDLGKSTEQTDALINKRKIGGVLLLGGSKDAFTDMITGFKTTASNSGSLPLIFSEDAEPSLMNLKITGIKDFPPTNSIKTVQESGKIANDICQILKEIGINQNYAPVCDFELNKEIIGNRSFGSDENVVSKLAGEFIKQTQSNNIIATAKHFPGHGNVKGDTHKELVYIDGEMKELGVFAEMIKQGVISVMVGHIAIKNNDKYNTNGKPSTLSRKIVTSLLKEELGFKGIVVTDGMNMGALDAFKSASLSAIKAGCDMILMPGNESQLINSVKKEMNRDDNFRLQIYESVKKIIRAKICLGLIGD